MSQHRKSRSTTRARSSRTLRQNIAPQLPTIAADAWKWAEHVIEPTRVVSRRGSTQRVLGVEEDVRKPRSVREARQVVALLLKRRRPRGAKGDHRRHWAIWRMMNVLLEWTEIDESSAVVFPYPRPYTAAVAVVEGFRLAGIDTTLNVDRVLRHYQRHFQPR
jgi:hypothetical protein